jgi:L-asparaginase
LDAAGLVAAVPQLRGVADIETISFRQSPSPDLTFEDMALLSREIDRRFSEGVTGVVVTQGTDTIEETSFALSLLLRGPRPVVVTGAMRNPTLPGADGPANLLAAVQVAAAATSERLGTVVVMNDEIHAPQFVRKMHTSSPSAFRSSAVGPMGWVLEGRPQVAWRPTTSLPRFSLRQFDFPNVALFKISLGDDGRMIEQVERLGYAGLVIEAFGGGHVPAGMVSTLESVASNLPVVLTSRTGSGSVLRETYGFAGSERDLIRRGLVNAGILGSLKARVLMTVLLADGADLETIRRVVTAAGTPF